MLLDPQETWRKQETSRIPARRQQELRHFSAWTEASRKTQQSVRSQQERMGMSCSSRMRKQEPDKYPLHCRTPLMTQKLVASTAARMLQEPQPPTGCDVSRTGPDFGSVLLKPFPPAQALGSRARKVPEEAFADPSRQCSVFPSHLSESFHTAINVFIAVHG